MKVEGKNEQSVAMMRMKPLTAYLPPIGRQPWLTAAAASDNPRGYLLVFDQPSSDSTGPPIVVAASDRPSNPEQPSCHHQQPIVGPLLASS
ncbi:hypothetical protein Acr_01g0012800 [Actinidia rufa]|uniref:Uncharacterized protein n=1 Tax=Actinidia rufa TaxID=165716 RepID=A0A7J0E4Q4_9ERIC|nr:hypothetical protein Acr_01g0012800 [Actinidia rufa]